MRIEFSNCHRFCDGVRRRDFIKVGSLTAAGLGLADLFRLQGEGAVHQESGAKAKSVILLFMGGGASHIDTFDLKPLAPAKYRGSFDPISTVVPGISICEHLSLTAQQFDKMSLIRSVHHSQPEHQQAAHYMLTGWMPSRVVFQNEHPSLGSVVVQEIGDHLAMPPYVVAHDPATFVNRHHGAAFLGHENEPLKVRVPFQARHIPPPTGMTLSAGMTVPRMRDRRSLVQTIDRRLRRRDEQVNAGRDGYDHYKQKAFDILTSPQAATAFDLSREPDRVRERYGRNLLGQGCLLARRLVDSGVRFVTISKGGWDTHQYNFEKMDEVLLPQLDRALSALLEDLHQRGLLESTLVVWNGEFGRTPIINKDAGRDHWPNVMTIGLAGGGISGGQVIGRSDEHAAFPQDHPVTPEDVWATMFHQLGIDWSRMYKVPESREFSTVPETVPILPYGTPIRELL